ncbi:MAG: triphosphoribosyl-dephospho-CoA synthetase [Planctomycetaceae bacterium]|nr:MAG: triphosphoribosyl-dephospho-CoA synthetase [Planctomycetaceae bacterium]
MQQTDSLWLEHRLRSACTLEVLARKPGNVHPQAAFDDLDCGDFLRSAAVAAPVLARSAHQGVGQTVLDAVRATRNVVSSNTNLGMLLLLAPLAAVPRDTPLADGIEPVLAALTREDAESAYEAIRLAAAGGLGDVAQGDVAGRPTGTLREMMALAEDRDTIASEYSRGFPLVLNFALPALRRRWRLENWEQAIIGLHLELMAQVPDTLIARKCGLDIARESAERAARVLSKGWPREPDAIREFGEFDTWLRAAGHTRNPGTTADLVAAALFALFRESAGAFDSALAVPGFVI